MRRLIPIICTVLLGWAAWSCRDAAALTLARMTVTLANDSIHVRVPVGLPATADSAHITLTMTPGGAQTVTVMPPASAAVFAFPAPAEGATVTLKACGLAYHLTVPGPNSCNNPQSYTRPITAPGSVTWPDSMVISALTDSKPVGDLAIQIVATSETCLGEWRDHHGALLVAPQGPQTPGCDSAFHATDHPGQVGYDNMATLAAQALTAPWTARQDSLWRSAPPPVAALPTALLVTDYVPGPMSGDTFVYGGGADNGVPIQTYRSRHPGFAWPAGT